MESTPTGGAGGGCVVVSSAADLKTNLSKSEPLTIYIKGAVEFTSLVKAVAVNKTLIGLPGSYLFSNQREKATSGILYLSRGSNNFIMRNVTFKSAGAYDCDGSDNFCIDGATNIWIDHCDFQDGVDGNFDCKNGSNNVAVTWCRFRYLKAPMAGGSGGSGDHRYTNLWGSSDNNASKDEGKLNTTFQFCWWDEGCRERMPRVRFGKVHIVNCLYKSSVANYCCGAGNNSSIYVERSAFIGVKNPYADYSNSNGAKGMLKFDNCMFVGCSGNTQGTGQAFHPSQYYQLSAIDASQVEQVVTSQTNGAGATLTFSECDSYEEINPITPPATDTTTYENEPTLTKRGTGSSTQEVEFGHAIIPFGYSWTDADSIKFEGLPQGVRVEAGNEPNRMDVSGTPTEAGTFKFTVKTIGGTKEVTKSGTITIKNDPTGVAEPHSHSKFRLAQNKANGAFSIQINCTCNTNILIFSLNGQLMRQIQTNSNGYDRIEVDTSEWANGTYAVKCVVDNEEYEAQVIVHH